MAMTIRVIPPTILEYLPVFLPRIPPNTSPVYVRIELIIINIIDDNRKLWVMDFKIIPTIRLSILTDNPKIKKLCFISISLLDMIRFIPRYIKIIMAIIFNFKIKYDSIIEPKK
jgi:hypothetical protein